MRLRQLYESVWHRRSLDCGDGKPLEHASQIMTAIETVAELSEVARQMLEADRVVGSMQGVLDIAQHGIDPFERPATLGHVRPVHRHRTVAAAVFAHRS